MSPLASVYQIALEVLLKWFLFRSAARVVRRHQARFALSVMATDARMIGGKKRSNWGGADTSDEVNKCCFQGKCFKNFSTRANFEKALLSAVYLIWKLRTQQLSKLSTYLLVSDYPKNLCMLSTPFISAKPELFALGAQMVAADAGSVLVRS